MTQEQAGTRIRWAPSPLFLGLIAVAAVSGWALWNLVGVDRSAADGGIVLGLITFVFVAASWVITLCLHEFGHAIVAYRNGDLSVAHRGYLTLDPLRYTHALFSIVLPLLFVLLGGIGLPGGAVFIDRRALRTRFARTAVSAAGPLMNLAVAVVLLQFAIKTFDLAVALTNSGPGISTTFPATYVYDLMFQRGEIGEGAAAAMMILAALAVVLVPYSLYLTWRRKKESGRG